MLCESCKVNKRQPKGGGRLHKKCTSCRRKPYKAYKKDYCERCGFIAVHLHQLDVDHIDGDHNNNAPENLMTLCANCHRLKTVLAQDFLNKPRD